MRRNKQNKRQKHTEPYSISAQFYDIIGQYIDYAEIVSYLEDILFDREKTPQSILDLGCGTGEVALLLSQKGYDVTGVDISAEMLEVARRKIESEDVVVDLVKMPVQTYVSNEPFDCVISLSDTINHLLYHNDVQRTFDQVFHNLAPGGIFIFDINTPHEIQHVMSVDQEEVIDDIKYTWEGSFDMMSQTGTFVQTFHHLTETGEEFIGKEVHKERAYKIRELRTWLKNAGFTAIETYEPFTLKKPRRENIERIYFVAERPE